ncbi:Arginase/deacetylase [Myriangium duriaei CBS 260.36]|uniref:Arginase/deacetylase n=1 Tax=Myriangium duriaei CBS 260.36 TaxID=1168546 RepID=A0A9P4IYG5_9PEZI|nr:Arginase/deacetylase [Myriangium duriaei CBS 260.36]
MLFHQLFAGLAAASLTAAHDAGHTHHHEQKVFSASDLEELQAKWGTDWGFSGISTFAHLPHVKCLTQPSQQFDIAVIGAPFDTAVSYRPGARFGPRAIRAGSARQNAVSGFNPRARLNPYKSWASILDCGDIPVTPFDNSLALKQMTQAFKQLSLHTVSTGNAHSPLAYRQRSKLLTLGGDHTIALPALRALQKRYSQPITVIHFDAHLDTWHPARYTSAWVDFTPPPEAVNADDPKWTEQSWFTHGNMFWLAHLEGLMAANTSVHAGLRTRLSGVGDEVEDDRQGWLRIASDDIDELGWQGVANKIIERVTAGKGIRSTAPIYLSIDIDVIDPGLAPATGTPEPGGWTTRELIRVLRGIEGLNVVGADIVEVSPAYDSSAEQTSLVAAQVAYEVLTSMVRRGLLEEEWANEVKSDPPSKDEL